MGYLQTVRFVCIVLLDITVVASSPLSLWKKKNTILEEACVIFYCFALVKMTLFYYSEGSWEKEAEGYQPGGSCSRPR